MYNISTQRIFIPAITAFSRRLKWFVRHATAKLPRNYERFAALILANEVSKPKYFESLPIQPKTSTGYPRQ